MKYTEAELYESGWKCYRVFPRWKVFYRKNVEARHDYWNCLGMDFITLFRNGRAARGHYAP